MSELSYLEKLLDGVEVKRLPLGELGELVRGNGLPKSDFTESGVPAIHYGQIYTFTDYLLKQQSHLFLRKRRRSLKRLTLVMLLLLTQAKTLLMLVKRLFI
ncbi:hypothetical protein O5472_13795 [Escherichia coli]|nr:hypothetical protein [Escherichia coli]